MDRPVFSIITPVHVWNDYRKGSLQRAIKSVEQQTFQDFEMIVVDDGSPIEFSVPDWVKVIHQPHAERIHALNTGFKNAQGHWFTLLDSDDAYEQNYLERFLHHIGENPDNKLFNCASVFHHADGAKTQRDSFKPDHAEIGHQVFGGGNIVNGTFVWHRNVYETMGGFPEDKIGIDCSSINYGGVRDLYMHTPYDFSAAAQLEFPEIQQYFFVDHENEPNKIIKELGNPWGNDFYLFYKYTRRYQTVPFDEYLLNVYIKKGVE